MSLAPVYLEHGHPVIVVCGWGPGRGDRQLTARIFPTDRQPNCGPRNVAIRRADGSIAVKPFRSLRKIKGDT